MAGKLLKENAKHHRAFEAWYDADRSVVSILEKTGVSEANLHIWKESFGWHERADKRDAEIQAIIDKKAVKDRVNRIEQHRKAGTLLRGKGVQRFNSDKMRIRSDKDAMNAIKMGIDIERMADDLASVNIKHSGEIKMPTLTVIIDGTEITPKAGIGSPEQSD